MAQLTVPLAPDSLTFIVEATIDNIPSVKDKLKQDGKPVPAPLTVKALIDTGANSCAATQRVLNALGLPSKSDVQRRIMTAGGPIMSRQFVAAIAMAQVPEIRVGYATVCRYDFENAPFELILGMTALMRWNFSYSRIGQKLTIELP